MSGLVKHYQNTMQGIPQLRNAWGSMIKLLDAVLVTGFNIVPILSLSKATPASITATIHLGSEHGFIDRQVVRIAGSTNGWDGDYKVLSADGASITIECAETNSTTILGTATCFTAPLDFEIVFQTPVDSIEPKRAYRSTDPESLGLILLVHDFCSPGAAATGAKFAKVGIVSDMSDIDTIVGNQMPFDSSNQDANWGWDGTYHGWAKWYYKWYFSPYGAGYSANDALDFTSTEPSPFIIAGSNDSFLMEVKGSSDISKPYYELYGIGEFYDARLGAKNLALLAFGLGGKFAQSASIYPENRNTYLIAASQKIKGSTWFNGDGIAVYENMGYAVHIATQSVGGGNPAGLNTGKVVFIDSLITIGNEIVGTFPFLKNSTVTTSLTGISGVVGKYKTRYNLDNNIWSKYAILMESR